MDDRENKDTETQERATKLTEAEKALWSDIVRNYVCTRSYTAEQAMAKADNVIIAARCRY